jgi:nucleotide-binding universal stress UspA family protein
MRVLLCADNLADTTSAASWLARMAPVEASPLCIAAIARTGLVALRPSPALAPLADLIARRARDLVETAAEALRDRWPDPRLRVIEGDPHEHLLRAAAEWKADLVVVGLGADSGESPSLGSVARVAAHHLDCSVLLARSAPEPACQVVLGMDGSPSAREAGRLLSVFGLTPPPRVLALGIVDTSWRRGVAPEELPPETRSTLDAIEAKQASEARAVLDRGTAPLAGQAIVESEVSFGRPTQALLDAARKRSAGLIAIGHQGLEPVRRLSLGSVAGQILAAAPCSLLIGRK